MDSAVFDDYPVPLDGLRDLPGILDGSQGDNRRPQGNCQIQANYDWQAIQCWLAEFEGSPQTHNRRVTGMVHVLPVTRQPGAPLRGHAEEAVAATRP